MTPRTDGRHHRARRSSRSELLRRQGDQWQFDPDPAHAREIEVRFTADGPEQTVVELEHRLLDRLVDGQALREGITGGGGWTSFLEQFAKAATNQA